MYHRIMLSELFSGAKHLDVQSADLARRFNPDFAAGGIHPTYMQPRNWSGDSINHSKLHIVIDLTFEAIQTG